MRAVFSAEARELGGMALAGEHVGQHLVEVFGEPVELAELGDVYVNGIGLPRDRTRGMDLLRRGCAGGYEWGCDQLKAAGGSR